MVEKPGPHIPLHVGAHHMALVADVVFAEALEHIHDERGRWRSGQEGGQDLASVLPGKEPVDGAAQELGVQKIHDTLMKGGAQKIQEKYGLIWPVILDKSL